MYNQQRRGNEYRALGRKNDLEYHPTDQHGIQYQLQDFRLFRRGFRGRIRHVLSKEDPLMESKMHIFDYRYLKWAGKHTRRVEQTVFFLESQKLGLAEFYMQPENFFHRIGEALGMTSDIDFEEHVDFSYNYRLTGNDEDFIRHNFNDDVLRFFAIEKGWSMEGLGFYLILYKNKKVLDPKVMDQLYRKGSLVYQAFVQTSK